MLLLFETPAGYALFSCSSKVSEASAEEMYKEFTTADKAGKMVKLKNFTPFGNTTDAVVAATSIVEGKLDKGLKKFLTKNIINK